MDSPSTLFAPPWADSRLFSSAHVFPLASYALSKIPLTFCKDKPLGLLLFKLPMLLVKLKVPRGVLFISSLSHQNTSWGFLRPKVLNAFPSAEHFCKTNHLQPCLHQLALFFLAAFCLHIVTIADEWNRMKVGNLHRLHAPSLYCCPLQSVGMCIQLPTCSRTNTFLRAQLVVINSTSAFKTMLQLKVNMILLSS